MVAIMFCPIQYGKYKYAIILKMLLGARKVLKVVEVSGI